MFARDLMKKSMRLVSISKKFLTPSMRLSRLRDKIRRIKASSPKKSKVQPRNLRLLHHQSRKSKQLLRVVRKKRKRRKKLST